MHFFSFFFFVIVYDQAQILSVEKERAFLTCGLSLSFDKIIVVLCIVNVFFMVCNLH
jgi:FtsH-binding integral membrane protein